MFIERYEDENMVKFIIHGGCGSREAPKVPFSYYHEKLREIVNKGKEYANTHTAQELVLFLAKLLEDEPIFNAGTGSRVQQDGEIRMSASYMDSKNEKFSAVMNIQNIQNPCYVAYSLQNKYNSVLAGVQATEYAHNELNLPYYNPMTDMRLQEYKEAKKGFTGTIGVVVWDSFSRELFAMTSTGGIGFETAGRVGDTPTVAGNYATQYLGISCTGKGEQIVNHGLAVRIESRVRDGMTLKEAVVKSMNEANDKGYYFGVISIDIDGNIVADNTIQAQTLFAVLDGDRSYTFFEK